MFRASCCSHRKTGQGKSVRSGRCCVDRIIFSATPLPYTSFGRPGARVPLISSAAYPPPSKTRLLEPFCDWVQVSGFWLGNLDRLTVEVCNVAKSFERKMNAQKTGKDAHAQMHSRVWCIAGMHDRIVRQKCSRSRIHAHAQIHACTYVPCGGGKDEACPATIVTTLALQAKFF